MAVKNIKDRVTLKLELDDGIVKGVQKVQSKSFGKVKTDALDEDIHGTAVALSELQSKDLLKVKRVEESTLVME